MEEDKEELSLPEEAWDFNPLVSLKEEAPKHKPSDLVYPCGYRRFDEAMEGGFRDEDLVLIAAPSSHGKSTLAMTLTYAFSRLSIPSLWLSYEMNIYKINEILEGMGVDSKHVLVPPVKKGENMKNDIDSISYYVEKAIDIHGCRAVFIDHLDRLITRDNTRNRNKWDEQAFIAQDLKKLAMRKGVAIFLLHQTRKMQHGVVMDQSAVKGSQNVVSECDYVIMMERKRYDEKKEKKDSILNALTKVQDKYTLETEVWIEKNRLTGRTPSISMTVRDGKFIEITNNYENNTV